MPSRRAELADPVFGLVTGLTTPFKSALLVMDVKVLQEVVAEDMLRIFSLVESTRPFFSQTLYQE